MSWLWCKDLKGNECFTNVKYYSVREERNKTGKHQIFGRKLGFAFPFGQGFNRAHLGIESERNVQVFQTGWDGWGSEGGNFKDLHALISEHH